MTRLFAQTEWTPHFVKILSILGLTLLSVLAPHSPAHAAENSLEHARNTELADEPLTAIAGRHRSAFVGETVELAGDAVNLNGASAVSYAWTLVEAPRQSTSTLFLGDTRNPFLFVDREGIYVVELVVSDARRKSAPARIVISTPQPARQFATHLLPNATRGGTDTDGDGVTDEMDNCIEIANSDQRDTDGDLFGNACDADFNNDGIVNAQDLGLLSLAFFGTPLTPNWNPDADFNADDIVNAIDLGRFKALFFMPPGPSGLLPGINCGEFLTGTIDEPNDGDFYQLFLTAGQVVELAVSQTAGFVGSAARAFVYAPDGTLALIGTAQSQTTLIAAQTGVYQVVVRAANGFATGSYGIGLICISPAAPVIAILDCGDLATGTIDAAGEAKLYTFDAQAGDLLAVSIGQSTGFVGAAARAFVYSPDGSFLTTFTAQSQGLFTATLSGRYVIKVAASNFFATGSYSIGISCLNPVDPDATNLTCGDLVISTIDQAGEADLYTFSAQAGDVLTVTMAQSSGFAGTAARAQVFSPAGDFLATFTAQEQTLFTAPVAGVYVVKVAAANFFAQGTYSIGINCISPVDAQATALGCGDLEVATIDVFGEADLYTFDVEAGAILTVTMAQSSGFAGTAARAWVYSPTGQPLGVYTAQQQGLFTAAESGTHIIKVAAANFFATGTYAIGLTCINPIDAADGTLSCGTPVASSISSFGEADLYTFDAQAGDELTMTMAQSAGFIGSVARAQLFSPTGQFLATYTAQSNTVFSVPESGTYALKVAAANFFATGDYTVGKVCVFPTSPVVADIACNTSESANIVQVGESDLFTFSATTGDDLTISLTQTAGFAGTVARAWLFSPGGQFIALYTANSSNAFVPAQTGTFILRVAAANVIGTGDVDLGLACN